VTEAVKGGLLPGDPRPGVEMRSSSIAQIGEGIAYAAGSAESLMKSGEELADAAFSAWRNGALISLSDTHHKEDKVSLRALKQVMHTTF
jgi:hypothetical protein